MAEVVALAELLTEMRTISSAWASSLAKMSVLGTSLAAREEVGKEAFLVGAQDGADPILGGDVAVEVGWGVGKLFVELLPAQGARQRVAPVDRVAGLDRAAASVIPRVDAVDLAIDVDAIGDGSLAGVFHDQIAVEEAEGEFGGRGGEADEGGVEILEHLPPEVVDRAVALVDDDEIEELDGNGSVVGELGALVIVGPAIFTQRAFFVDFGQVSSPRSME